MIDPYVVLGVPRDAYKRDIQARFETLKSIWDPSKHTDPILKQEALDELAKIEEAYAILNDPHARVAAHYDSPKSEIEPTAQQTAPRKQASNKVEQNTTIKPASQPVEQTATPKTTSRPVEVAASKNEPSVAVSQSPAATLPAQTTLIKERVIQPKFIQKIWWIFAILALVLGGLLYNMYNVMLQVAADRDARIAKINSYIGKTNDLNDQIATQQAEIETLNEENSGLRSSLQKKNSDLTSMTSKFSTLTSKVFCTETRNKTVAINKSLVQLVNSYRDITNSYATDEQLFQNNVYSMSRFRVWYSGGYVEQFFYYTNSIVVANNLPSDVFWATEGCWIK